MDIQYKSNSFLQDQKQRLFKPDLKPNEENNIKYELVENIKKDDSLGDMTVYLPQFMELLWKQPKVVSKILLNASNKEMSEHLSYFFCHNFYENILSPDYIEYNLLYLITLMLKEEINNIHKKYPKDPIKSLELFLNNTPSSILLEQFQKKNDVQTFFNTILLNIIEQLERNSSNREIIFDLNKIESKFKERKVSDSRSQSKSIDINVTSYNFCMNEAEFFKSYAIDMDSKYFNDQIFSYKEHEKIKVKEFFQFYSNLVESDKKKNLFNSTIFKNKNKHNPMDSEVLDEYITNFEKAINLINDLFKNLSDNLFLLPYSIKCICKIIFSLINKNLKGLKNFHLNAFISKFFFEKLFNPIFQNPALGALINSFIISTSTLKNLEEISKIILTFTSGNLFHSNKKETEFYTPFNAYFLSKIENLFKFYEEITKVELPLFIEKLINDELDENYEYDFFKENPEEVVHHLSVCFNVDELNTLLEIMEKNKKKIFNIPKKKEKEDEYNNLNNLMKTFEKLVSKICKESMKKARNNHEYEMVKVPLNNKKKKEYKEVKGRKIIKYYLMYEILFRKDFSDLINITQDKKFFNIKEINKSDNGNKDDDNDDEDILNKIIKVKNFFSTILYNYRMLVKTDFEEDKLSNTIDILKELKKMMRSSNNMLIVNFPSQWYVDSLLDYLGKIPKKYLEDDCEFLITDLQNDINKSIKSMNFEDLSILIHKMKFATRGKNFYENVIDLVIDMKINKNAQNIVEKENLEIEIAFKYNDIKKEFKIYKPLQSAINLQLFDNLLETPKEKGIKVCNSILAFTRSFPNFQNYKKRYKKTDLFDFLKEMKVPKQINNFFKIIEDSLKNDQNITDEKKLINMNDKINDFVMEKLYEKIYPKILSKEDEEIFDICEKLKEKEPNFFIKTKKPYNFESFLPDLTNYLLQIEKEKSVRKKFLNLKKIFECMNNLSDFNGGDKFDLDTQVQILSYVLVKAKPNNIYTNYRYMELFIGDKHGQIEGQNLLELKLVCEHLLQTYSTNIK